MDPESSHRIYLQASVTDTIELEALSKEALRTWLRTLMGWEPDGDFISWLYKETSGFPGSVKRGLEYLLRREILTRKENRWQYGCELLDFKLASHIGVTATPVIHNLPEVLTSFVGREAEIEKGKELLERGRLLTILGPGGIGKTRLAHQIAAEILDRYPDGACYVPLVSVQSADFIIPAIADALGFSFYGNRSPFEQLLDYLRQKEILILLDNFELLVNDSGILADLLRKVPGLRLLVTSRQLLNLQAERIMELGPMDVPTEEFPRYIERYSSVQLFLDKARRVKPGFLIAKEDARFMGRICRLVEGVPLGIELAASWVRSLTVREIAAEIDRGYDFLTSSLRDVPHRHRSLRLVFDYSWELLGAKERDVYAKISVFRGGFSRQAAADITGASLPLLSLLIDKSLVSRDKSGRFHMLELLRRFGQHRLEENPDNCELFKDLHSRYFGDFLNQRERELTGAGQSRALTEITADIENVRAGFRRGVEKRDVDTVDKYLNSLSLVFEYQGKFAEAKELFAWAHRKLTGIKGLVPSKIRALEGTFSYRLGDVKRSKKLIEKSLGDFRELGAANEIADTLGILGNIAYRRAEYIEAEKVHRQSLEIHQDIGYQPGIGNNLAGLASIASQHGKYEQAKDMFTESLQVLRGIDNHRNMARVLNNLGNIHVATGSYQDAFKCYEESLKFYGELGHKWGVGIVLGNLSEAAMKTGNYPRARKYLEQSLAICREIGDQEGVAYSLSNMGETALAEDDTGKARDFFKQALEVAQGVNHHGEIAHAYAGLGNVAMEFGSNDEARSLFKKALEASVLSGQTRIQSEILADFAFVEMKDGDYVRAVQLAHAVADNPASENETRERVLKILRELKSTMPEPEFDRAGETAKLKGVEESISDILSEFD